MKRPPLVLIILFLMVAGYAGGVLNLPAGPPAAEPQGGGSTATPTASPTPTTTGPPTATQTSTEVPAVPTPSQLELSDGGPDDGTAWRVSVDRVIDGSTIQVTFPNGATDTVQLLGVYTPKTSLGDSTPQEWGLSFTQENRMHLVEWGKQGSYYAQSELEGMEVVIEIDDESDRTTELGRLLVYVYAHEENFNRQLLAEGYAKVSDHEFSKRGVFEAVEHDARVNDVGVWDYEAFPTPEPTPTESGSNDGGGDVPPVPADGDYDCGDFESQAQAQIVLDRTTGDPHRLDADGDGSACDGLA